MDSTAHSAITYFVLSDGFMWCLGISMPLLFTYAVWFIYRLNKNSDALIEPTLHIPPVSTDGIESASRERMPENESAVADSLELARIPSDDIPPDLRSRGRLEKDEEGEARGPIHSLKQINRTGPEALPAPTELGSSAPPEPGEVAPLKSLSSALANTRQSFFGRLKSMFAGRAMLESSELEDLEEILYTSDLGPKTVQRLMGAVEAKLKTAGASGFDAVREALKSEMLGILTTAAVSTPSAPANITDGLENLAVWNGKPALLMVVGVNGAGKTTTIGKLASRLALSGKKVLVAAGDTFRAAAGDQLKIWTKRAQVEIFFPDGVSDPSAVAYAACQKAQSEGFDIVIVDTAGRLHTQKNLMEELKKMKRVVQKLIPDAPHEVLLVLDSNSGQNALIQAREFHQALGVTGVVLTKLDGTAKGGVAIGIACELQLPIKLIGVGEGMDDLRRFSPVEFVDSII